VDANETRVLARLGERRPRSFSEAADSALGALADVLPGVVALCQLDVDEQVQRVIETRGGGVAGLARGAGLPALGDELDGDFLRALGAESWLSAPLEASDGRIVGALCVAAGVAAAYDTAHAAELGIAARLLGREWENVELRAEVRRLRRHLNAGPGTDADTGLPSRERFLELLKREWSLADRGTLESVLIVGRLSVAASNNGATRSTSKLGLKMTAEVLEGSTRLNDRVGRIGETSVGAILVGCRLRDAPTFVARFLEALERVSASERPEIDVACGVQSLGGAASATDALELAEAAARESELSRRQVSVPERGRE